MWPWTCSFYNFTATLFASRFQYFSVSRNFPFLIVWKTVSHMWTVDSSWAIKTSNFCLKRMIVFCLCFEFDWSSGSVYFILVTVCLGAWNVVISIYLFLFFFQLRNCKCIISTTHTLNSTYFDVIARFHNFICCDENKLCLCSIWYKPTTISFVIILFCSVEHVFI